MSVRSSRGSNDYFVSRDFGLFAGFAGFLDNEVGNSAAVDFESFESFEVGNAVGDSCVKNFVGEFDETCVFGNEVSFAVEGEDSGEVTFVFSYHATFGCLTVFAFSGYSLSFFAEDFHCCLDVAVGFGEGFFAIHQAGACEGAELGDFSHCYCHNILILKKCF